MSDPEYTFKNKSKAIEKAKRLSKLNSGMTVMVYKNLSGYCVQDEFEIPLGSLVYSTDLGDMCEG